MATKTISITDEAYEALSREKRREESFTDVVLRLTRRTGKLADCFDSWKMTDKEEETIFKELNEGWRRTMERIVSEVH